MTILAYLLLVRIILLYLTSKVKRVINKIFLVAYAVTTKMHENNVSNLLGIT